MVEYSNHLKKAVYLKFSGMRMTFASSKLPNLHIMIKRACSHGLTQITFIDAYKERSHNVIISRQER